MTKRAQVGDLTPVSVALQSLAVVSVSLLSSLLARHFSVSSPLHLLWMLVLPLGIGWLLNTGIGRARMMIVLPIISFVGVGLAAVLIGYP